MAGTISPPPMMVTAAPISLKRSADRPTVRYLTPLRSASRGHFLLEPAKRLGRHRPCQEADKVEAEHLLHQFIIERLAAAVFDPAEHLVGAPAPGWRRSEQRKRLVLAVPVGGHTVAAIERAGEHRVLHFEGLGNRARRQQFDLQLAARHFIDTCDEIRRKLVKNVLGRPGALKLEIHRFLCARHIRHGELAAPAAAATAPFFRKARRESTSVLSGVLVMSNLPFGHHLRVHLPGA